RPTLRRYQRSSPVNRGRGTTRSVVEGARPSRPSLRVTALSVVGANDAKPFIARMILFPASEARQGRPAGPPLRGRAVGAVLDELRTPEKTAAERSRA